MAFNISSTAFEYGVRIPQVHTCDGEHLSLPLSWENEPKETVSFALIMEDPDAPNGTFTHWIVYNLPSGCHRLEKMIAIRKNLENGAIEGKNDFGSTGYKGPCPPRGEDHRYFIKIFALKRKLQPESIRTGADFYSAIEGLVLDQAEYMGRYKRST